MLRTIALTLLLSGCAADYRGFVWQDRTTSHMAYENGQPIWVIECEGAASACHERAAKLCPDGYEIEGEGVAGISGRTNRGLPLMQLKVSCRS